MNEDKTIITPFSLWGKWNNMIESSRRVYDPDGIAPTIHTFSGGNTEIKVIVHERRQETDSGV